MSLNPTSLLETRFVDQHIAEVKITRAHKRNALNVELVKQLGQCFADMPDTVRAIILYGDGDHFCAGLDLSEVTEHTVPQSVMLSRQWHRAFDHIQFGQAPVISVLHGAVVGGGLELAASTHIRIAEPSAFFALPEGKRGLFVGGGGSVRITRLMGVARMSDMMLTGRVLSMQEGAEAGLAQYTADTGKGLDKARELALSIASNATMTNYGVMHMLPRIADQTIHDGLATESLMAAVAQTDPDTQALLRQFLEHKQNKVQYQRQ